MSEIQNDEERLIFKSNILVPEETFSRVWYLEWVFHISHNLLKLLEHLMKIPKKDTNREHWRCLKKGRLKKFLGSQTLLWGSIVGRAINTKIICKHSRAWNAMETRNAQGCKWNIAIVMWNKTTKYFIRGQRSVYNPVQHTIYWVPKGSSDKPSI